MQNKTCNDTAEELKVRHCHSCHKCINWKTCTWNAATVWCKSTCWDISGDAAQIFGLLPTRQGFLLFFFFCSCMPISTENLTKSLQLSYIDIFHSIHFLHADARHYNSTIRQMSFLVPWRNAAVWDDEKLHPDDHRVTTDGVHVKWAARSSSFLQCPLRAAW